MKRFLSILFLIFLVVGCSNKIELNNNYAMNPIIALDGITIVALEYNGLMWGASNNPAFIKEKVYSIYPENKVKAIYVESTNENIFYVFLSNKGE